MIFMILIGATLLGYYITQSQVPQRVVMAITEMSLNRWVVIGGIIVGYFIVSMFMDEIPLMIITLQLAFPLVVSLGFDPIWFGVITILMVAMGLVFPPVGLIAFIVSATTKVDVVKVYKGTSIMTIAIAITAVLIMIFPELALWLPSMMRG
jgi:TRAP-type C4-dicarboxylate transport system permease large subunit